ncbi:MAG: thiol-disulfide oxidoreductase DCC family protein [Solibacillus sp.]
MIAVRIVLFDGVCNICDASVQFIMNRDAGAHHFASLQSEVGQQLIEKYGLRDVDSVVLIEEGRAYTKSTAALRIARHLGVWKLFYALIVVPAPIRDLFYTAIAKNRYRLFGKKQVCKLPTAEERARFIE